jgi:hypothetical protein
MNFVNRVLAKIGVRSSGPAIVNPKNGVPYDTITFADLSETPDLSLVPPFDRTDVDESKLTPEQKQWHRDGVVILRGFLPDSVTDPYIERRERLKIEKPERFREGWGSPTPYEHVPEMRALALYPPLMKMMESLISEPMLLHLCLTGWVSTQRDWHQDDYLNPAHVNSWYTAVWMALDKIDPAAGPFEYVAGSHKWPLLRQEKVKNCMPYDERIRKDPVTGAEVWPTTSEVFVVPAIEAELKRQNSKVDSFIADKGDVLIWHGRLMHRGSGPKSPDLLRKSLITHYSGVNHRPDMANRAKDGNGMDYALFGKPLV